MGVTLVDEHGVRFVEGVPREAYSMQLHDVDRLIETCFAEGVQAVLLYPANLTPNFFDLSSGEAGSILQKLRNYRIRLAVVCARGEVALSSRFGEVIADELRGIHFGLFETRQTAIDWLREAASS